ncbi:hypothetical protein DFH08DRAFT_1086622 [Mycena albidolilacea]|uniref:Uncharacterized protein n=1 Tax=Mycena albidolilacea TaxID=1033008 RepID=A0AAD7EG38_9AGAR|nr:hypothetical protein DFH08DRAFT_1086622 [Mycena albidolilacea]
MPKAHSRDSLFTLGFLLLWSAAKGSQVNITIDDFDPSIVYAPPDSWNSSAVVCSACNNPPALLASQQTYHKGAHVVILDEDDTAPPSSPSKPPPPSPSIGNPRTSDNPASKASTTKSPSTSVPVHSSTIPNAVSRPPPLPSPPNESDNDKGAEKPDDDDKDDDRDHDDDDKPNKSHRGRRDRVPRADLDDTGFVDTPVFAQYNFTGTAVYIFCVQPLGMPMSPSLPSMMNISFSLDDVGQQPFVHQGSSSGSGFAYHVNVFAKQGLLDGLHVLKLNLAPNSMFILDYILVTQNVADTPSSSIPIQSQSSTPSSADGTTTKKGRDSFAGAVAGSLGVLGILCFGTAFSIYRRRRLAARRERLERGTAPPPAPMSGPAPFVPRYFPGTVVPSVPPPYAPSDTASSVSSHTHTAELAGVSVPLLATHPAQTYDADIDIAPPLDEIAPPSFGVAITTPAVTLLSSSDIAMPPPRPPSWGTAPDILSSPRIAPGSRAPSVLFSANEDQEE